VSVSTIDVSNVYLSLTYTLSLALDAVVPWMIGETFENADVLPVVCYVTQALTYRPYDRK